ncbi:unnamed protein product [Rotaria sp. Silwood2]|nr:unnamed protein product [Rotaria sp. Silwood2]
MGKNLQHVSILWSNPYLINSMSARSFYELIFSASSSESLCSCGYYLPKSHSSYIEPKRCQLSLLLRLEIEIIDDIDNNEEKIIVLSHCQHLHIRRFHIYNLLSLDIFDILMGYLPNLEKLYISMKFSSHPIDIFEQCSSIIHRIDRLKELHFRLTTDFWNIGQHQFEKLKHINPFLQIFLLKIKTMKLILLANITDV